MNDPHSQHRSGYLATLVQSFGLSQITIVEKIILGVSVIALCVGVYDAFQSQSSHADQPIAAKTKLQEISKK